MSSKDGVNWDQQHYTLCANDIYVNEIEGVKVITSTPLIVYLECRKDSKTSKYILRFNKELLSDALYEGVREIEFEKIPLE